MRLKQSIGLCLLTLLILFSGCDGLMYEEYNPDSSEKIDILSKCTKLSFGTSAGDVLENWIEYDSTAETVHLFAGNESNNAGKIAGSEDGLTFFFKEVSSDKNFKLSANVQVLSYGGIGTDGETTSNGQEGFGLMARDWVPQYPDYTIDDIHSRLNDADSSNDDDYYPGSDGGSSNMAMIGGLKRGVRAAMRQGVSLPSGVTDYQTVISDPEAIPDASMSLIEWWPKELTDYSMYPTLEDRPEWPPENSIYRFTLEKSNSGFRYVIDPPSEKGESQEFFVYEPDILTEINKDSFYVGFFAARSAEVIISDVEYSESNKSDDAVQIIPEPEMVEPAIEIVSPSTHSNGLFQLKVRANVFGYLSVKQDGITVADYTPAEWVTEPSNNSVEPFSFFDIPVYDLLDGENVFQVIFYPMEEYTMDGLSFIRYEDYEISSNKPIKSTFLVEKRTYFSSSTALYASPTGNAYASGSEADPLDINTAIQFVQQGQTIIMKNGVYEMESFMIPRYNDGKDGAPKRIEAETRDQVFIDFKKNINGKGAVLRGNYWEISGIHIRNTPDKKKGFQVMGSNNLIEWVKTYNNGDTGLQISGFSKEPKSWWPRNNTIRFCESFDNKDAAQTDADGFAAKLTVGEYNRFEWCVSHNNCDDGWDLFTKKETGTIGVVTIENCISYQNGLLTDGTLTRAGRNGFKLGGEGLGVPHVVNNCLSFNNGAHGFTSNSNPAVQLSNITSFNNGGRFNGKIGADSRNVSIYNGTDKIIDLPATMNNVLSIFSNPDWDGDGILRKEDKVQVTLPGQGYFWYDTVSGAVKEDMGRRNGSATRNANDFTLSIADIIETTPPLYSDYSYSNAAADLTIETGESSFTTQIGFIKRDSSGHFVLGNFMKLKESAGITAGCQF